MAETAQTQTTVAALQALYVAKGGDADDVADITTSLETILHELTGCKI